MVHVVQAAKDWGWREFVTLTSLFDIDAGFLVNDAVMFSAEVCCGSVKPCYTAAQAHLHEDLSDHALLYRL